MNILRLPPSPFSPIRLAANIVFGYSSAPHLPAPARRYDEIIPIQRESENEVAIDFEAPSFTRHCAATGREFSPGERYYSVLLADGADVKRLDYSLESWQGPPEKSIGFWKAQTPDKDSRKKHWAPNDVMLQFFDELGTQPDKWDMRYVLTLLLVRRRVFRLEDERRDERGTPVAEVYCSKRNATFCVPIVMPKPERVEEIQQELATLLE